MKNNKNILIIILGCLFFGGLAGWLIRGTDDHPDHEHFHVAEDGTIYTCSMHPQIRQDGPGQCPLCGMALTPVASGAGNNNPFVLEMTPEAVALSNVQLMRVKSGQGTGKITLTGKIQTNEQRVKSLTANFAGRVDQLFVNFTGQEVRRGEKLATLYSPELVNAQKELLETAKIKERQPALYQAAKEKLRLWKISDEQINKIESSGQVQTQFDVYADVAGVVMVRNVSVGDFVNRGSVMFEIVDLSSVWVMLDAYESDLGAIRKGDELSFQVATYPGKSFAGKVIYIDPVLNPETRTVGIRAEAANRNFELKPEMFVSATISAAQASQSGLMIPKTAILWTGPRSVVYVQVGNREAPAFEMREIELGPRVGDDYLVFSGVEEGEQVVSNGVFAIDAAAQLSGNYSMMMRPEVKTLEVPEAFKEQLTALTQSYLSIKDGLVASNVQATQQAINPTKASLAKVEASLLDGKAGEIWGKLLGPIRSSLDKMATTSNVEEQRKQFEILSDNLIDAVEYFGIVENTIYRQYCPMAFKDQGAYWLSGEKEIRNPYFGDMMLTCGEVKETYQPGKRVAAIGGTSEEKAVPASATTHDHSAHTAHDHSAHAGPSASKSPRTAAMANIGKSHVHVDYAAPSVRGREIFGGLVGYGDVWVTGAHMATNISFNQDLEIGGKRIPAGKYAIFTIPRADKWTLILNKNFNQHLADDYDEKEDVARWEITSVVLKESVEKMTFEVISTKGNEGKLRFAWSDRSFEVPLKSL
ncbi:efflux RND transporter periplasmic adaptor subunit [Mongoliitalea daihaiensis]|uniref:efflux RND transporter periplasmic adaptor subunit n=1 Tax=Mongoliitalea daihaiensis TaxID=2782006 RepID=UPI001F1E6219|nr:efflux RND transporter periplasmic adaptor subunit [Mongoliitalea daihaiensis]UJP64710.1 efflux RND transporter periplasmic adaptor subunit [Mongoliitalea daihaiensis]